MSLYKAWVEIPKSDYGYLDEKIVQEKHPTAVYIKFSDKPNLDLPSKKYTVVAELDGTKDCRERLLGRLKSFLPILESEIRHHSDIDIPKVYVLCLSENNEETLKIAKEFSDKFLIGTDFKIHVTEYGPLVSYEISNWSRDSYMLSLLLYILRKREIMEYLVREADYAPLETILMKEFLLHSSWGNSGNSNILLSLFCYSYGEGFGFGVDAGNGPCTAVMYSISTHYLLNYIKEVFIPTLPDVSSTTSIGLNSHYMSEEFKYTFNELLQLIKYRQEHVCIKRR